MIIVFHFVGSMDGTVSFYFYFLTELWSRNRSCGVVAFQSQSDLFNIFFKQYIVLRYVSIQILNFNEVKSLVFDSI